MNRPHIIVNVVASVDGRIAIGPNMTMWDQMSDPRLDEKRAGEIWTKAGEMIEHQADMLGSNSLIK